MSSHDQREETLFNAALQLTTPEERAAYLQKACPDDEPLRQRVLALLQAHEQAETLLDKPAAGLSVGTMTLNLAVIQPAEKAGDRIGRYKLLEQIGEGGCGVVYVAEQEQPVRRRVALKVIKLGMDTKQVIARFEAERQALAMMDHPNIARVLDAGATEKGRPFFVMELVKGIRITDYCDQNNLSTIDRLGLFIQVCHAIQHAHQKGIIHRDIKPSNILVTMHDGVPVPKVIDFGIAKATTDLRLTDKTVYTAIEQFIGTPAYMSPEQAELSGLDIDTRSDIYALGVLLYELLTGRTPFDSKRLLKAGLDEIRRIIREEDPPRPSTRISTLEDAERTSLAKRRHCEGPRLIHLVRGDLDWIVMKTLEKDRTRRYETANGLAMDIRRHLANEPILARPPSRFYRLQKSIYRNKAAFAAGLVITAMLVLGILFSTAEAVRATRAKWDALQAQALEAVQREKAQASEKEAIEAQNSETKLRQQAEAEELAARQRAYASDMNLAEQALADNKLGRAQELLNQQRPQPGQKDLRGWEWRYLWQFCQSDASYTLCQTTNDISALSVSPDGQWLAVGLVSGSASVWDLRTRQEFSGPWKDVEEAKDAGMAELAFSPRSSLLAYSFDTGDSILTLHSNIRLWDVATRRMVGDDLPLNGYCFGLAFTKDGRTLVTGTRTQITLWQIPQEKMLVAYPVTLRDGRIGRNCFVVTQDGSLAAGVKSDGKVCVIDLATGKERWSAKAAEEMVTALAFSPDGKLLASGAGWAESAIRLWDVASGREIGRLEGHRAGIGALVFFPDGKTLASASADQTIRLWDVTDVTKVPPARVLRGHKLEVWDLALSPDTTTLVSGCKDGSVCVWDTKAAHARNDRVTIPDQISHWQFAPDSKSILALDQWGRETRRQGTNFQQKEPLLDIGTNFSGACLSGDGRFLAVGSSNGIVQVWDLQSRALSGKFEVSTNLPPMPERFLNGGKTLVIDYWANDDLEEWDWVTGKRVRGWTGATNYSDVSFSPDDRLCVTFTNPRGIVALKDLTDGHETNLTWSVHAIYGATFSPDGKLLALSSSYGFAKLWDVGTQRELATLHGFLLGVHSAAFSPDSQRLALSSGGKEAISLWDVSSRQEVLTLEAQGSKFMHTAFSPDGNILGCVNENSTHMSASINGSGGILYLWRAPSWEEIAAAEKLQAQP